ncbi:putative ferric-chelate reductase 1 isoform X2 [Channa argus]|uniref:putative ferric-chelate reductase 1 isoform X2 n=1 Tax=Channa argus TaxID=215402 RepID=UPI003521A690
MDFIGILLLLCVAPVVWCFPSGQVTASCDTMIPQHLANAQSGTAPYSISLDRSTYNVGDQVKVTLKATGASDFEGFLLKAQEVGGQSTVGTFTVSSSDSQTLACSQKPNSAVSHTKATSKMSIQVTWTADSTGSGKSIQFYATFVHSEKIFWVSVTSAPMTFNGSSGGSPGSTATAPAGAAMNISSAACGVTKTCLSQPSNCDPSASSDCYFMSAMLLSGGTTVRYEMIGPSSGYVAFGFSDDQSMGNDDIYICSTNSAGMVTVEHAYSTGATTPISIPLGNLAVVMATIQNNVIGCTFTTTNSISTQRSTGFNQTYYLLFAYGSSNSAGQIQIHSRTFTSSNKVDISKAEAAATETETPAIVKAHGALMLISWMTTGTLGMIVARYLKHMAKGQQMFGKDVWFLVHVPVMCLTVAATIIAFIIIFVYGEGWAGGAHPVLGCLVMILSFIQPIVAFFRCGPQDSMRFVFNWTHSLNALAIKLLAEI